MGRLAGLCRMLDSVTNHRRKVPVPRRTLGCWPGSPEGRDRTTSSHAPLSVLPARPVPSEGRCKSSWIAEVFEVGIRNVKAARTHLAWIGWLNEEGAPHGASTAGGRGRGESFWSRSGRREQPIRHPLGHFPQPNQHPLIRTRNSLRDLRTRTPERGPHVFQKERPGGVPTLTQVVPEDLRVPTIEVLGVRLKPPGL